MDGKIKAPPPAGCMWLVGLVIFGIRLARPAGAFSRNIHNFNALSAISIIRADAWSHDYPGR